MYVLMGANGNITSKLTKVLCRQEKHVRVIGRNAEGMADLRKAGADHELDYRYDYQDWDDA